MPESLKIGFRSTLDLEGRRVARSHVDTDYLPRVIAHRVPQPPRPCSTQAFWISWMRLAGVGFQPFFSFAIMLAAWFSPKALSASSGLPSLAQAAWSRLCVSRVLKVRHSTNWSAVRRRSSPPKSQTATGSPLVASRIACQILPCGLPCFVGWRTFDQAWPLWQISSTVFHLLC